MPYVPSQHTTVSKPLGISGSSTDARSRYYDATLFKYRDYTSTAEVLSYLTTTAHRTGGFSIFINTGGTLSAGVITGGARAEWWFKDGTADGDLVEKSSGSVDLSGLVPYTEATRDVDLGANSLNAESLHVKGTGGAGHIALKHQTADATATTNETALFADSTGDLKLQINGNFSAKFQTSGNTANRTYIYQNRNGTVADDTDLALKAPLASPEFTGTPTAPTATNGTNTTQIATCAFVLANAPSITVDAIPTDGSTNPVSSNGVFDALAGKANNILSAGYVPHVSDITDPSDTIETAIGKLDKGVSDNTSAIATSAQDSITLSIFKVSNYATP